MRFPAFGVTIVGLALSFGGLLRAQQGPAMNDDGVGIAHHGLEDLSGGRVVEHQGINFKAAQDLVTRPDATEAAEGSTSAPEGIESQNETSRSENGPLYWIQIFTLLARGIACQRVIGLVRERGTNFNLSGEMKRNLEAVGADLPPFSVPIIMRVPG
ncbi:MAG: hypothetical protein LAO04_05595 [Acidobacteriia bacterium]|nr:hypothetical protein [Terriglobia bacterium]